MTRIARAAAATRTAAAARTVTAAALVATAVAIPAYGAAQAAAHTCTIAAGSAVAATAGTASYDLVGGLSGAVVGFDVGTGRWGPGIAAGYRRVLLDGPDADIGRLTAAFPLPLPLPLDPVGLAFCATGHAAAARLPVGGDAATVLAAGIGLRTAFGFGLGPMAVMPYAEVRGLAARSTGSLFGVGVGATGLAVGAEGGVRATFDRISLRVAGSVDGLDDGLGVTPYPADMVEVGIGIRF